MNANTREVIEQHWMYANDRDWDRLTRLLAEELRYEVPQTLEYIDSGAGYLDMFRTWPGDWYVVIKTLVCEGTKAVSVIDFVVGTDIAVGVSIFEVVAGKIVAVTDYWPEPYEPPARKSSHMQRKFQ